MGEENTDVNTDVVKKEDYNKIVEAHNTLKAEKEGMEKKIIDLESAKSEFDKAKSDWEKESKEGMDEFKKTMNEKMEKFENDKVERKGIVKQENKYGGDGNPLASDPDKIVKDHFSQVTEKEAPPEPGNLHAYGHYKNPATQRTYGTLEGQALTVSHSANDESVDPKFANLLLKHSDDIVAR